VADAAGTPTLEISDGRARIRLHRPEKRNRIEPADLEALIEHAETVRADDSVRVMTLEAQGPAWCSGYHLGALADGERPKHGFGDACDAIAAIQVPTIAVLAGGVYGGGTDLAVSCDFRLAADGVVLVMPAARIGIQYYASGLERFVSRIGPSATKRLFLTAEKFDSDELLNIGYLSEVIPADRLESRVDELCSTIGALAPLAVRLTKRAIDDLAGPSPDVEAVEAGHLESIRSEDHREAMRAMNEKRPPIFTGR
jgi:enoyl-CoA hydratase